MLEAAVQLARSGGYDALQVRAVAERAGVSSRTIYENFSSLDSLLITAVANPSVSPYASIVPSCPNGGESGERVDHLVAELTATMTANRTLTVAFLRALLSGKPDVARHVHAFRVTLEAILVCTIGVERPTEADRDVAQMLGGIWFAALAGWGSGSETDVGIREIMHRASRRLLPNGATER
jgi:TetR/AcrR family transcriptional regulator, cholesterol catabolism regulator